jgi:hypothetical protein
MVGVADSQSQTKQVVTGPVATYWMSTKTTSGFGAGMMGGGQGGGRPSAASMMAMMGRGGGAQHSLVLQLGSSRAPTGAPEAEHLPPAGLGAGDSLPLVTPQNAPPAQRVEEEPSAPPQYQKPHGKMLIFWGCGEHARPGQPVVIDFAKVGEGQIPPGLDALTHGFGVTPMQPPSPTRNRTYGEWPNQQARTSVPSEGSLVGQHTVRGDYSPEINFTLGPDQDFLGPLQLVTNAVAPSGAGQLAWNPVPYAQGYLATAMGGGQDVVVLWSSSEIQVSAFAAPEYLSNHEIARLVASHGLMDPRTTSCAVPMEAVQAAPHALVQLSAYGDEANFSYPPRPTDPKVAWNIQWAVKVRYKSQTGAMLGMNMPGAMGGGRGTQGQGPYGQRPNNQQPNNQQPNNQQGQDQPSRPGLGSVLHGLGGWVP